MSQRLRKVVFPVAGLGTRFLPATKVVAKEMLPVLDRPLIQYAVDEAVDAGADTLIFVTNRYKHAIADYFDKAYELETKLEQAGKKELLSLVQNVLPKHVRCVFVTQPEALGLGHAVLCAKPVVGNEPFGVILPDDLIWNSGASALRQMAELAAFENSGVIAVEEVPREQTNKYGIVDATPINDRAALIKLMVEKPKPEDAPSNLAVVGRYVLPGRIFSLLESTRPGAGGEIQLTDAIDALLKQERVLAYRFEGERFDCGNKLGLVKATMHFALQDPALAAATREFVAGK
ncbi:MAG: UTP--glucose-1-phosphate uridylyltransferase [Lysobacterales bacterium 69-70]|nr:UTP--glucose-1-phosphate uridylyltransferase GalU [Xanthomonadaceae bacterium]ODU33419.1 MAG: UTP--glucose-1-phosphate uridylyltransferase [Xanthomonadaceae bacterium SCN 69-320]ODV17779.1 MAG: UTP--glucose-1-phosphate uridylyltransferase [Xanthomonadaceae bacterium SCN 69-25]OJZ00960.1 MAG: UTP--glucose-1-phosphate uridylyltransferase [Xanthomonadales bacterium 69-70]